MGIKLVALDLDGTLLDSKKHLSVRNRRALEACVEKGIYVVPATGRTVLGIPEELKAMPGIRYAITLNGGVLIDMAKNRVIDERKLDCQATLEILEVVSGFHVMYDAYIEGLGISESRFYDHLDEYNIPEEIQKLVRITRTVVPNIEDHIRQSDVPVEKINLYCSSLKDRETIRTLLAERNDIIISSSLENNLEINALGATKGQGIRRLADHLGLGIEETMACGDGENDLTMIQMAGIGVAMANGEEALKTLADYVTATNDEDGVAQAIERFALSSE